MTQSNLIINNKNIKIKYFIKNYMLFGEDSQLTMLHLTDSFHYTIYYLLFQRLQLLCTFLLYMNMEVVIHQEYQVIQIDYHSTHTLLLKIQLLFLVFYQFYLYSYFICLMYQDIQIIIFQLILCKHQPQLYQSGVNQMPLFKNPDQLQEHPITL